MLGAIVHWDHKVGRQPPELLRHMFQQYDYVARAYGARMVYVDLMGTLELLAPQVTIVQTLDQALACFNDSWNLIWMGAEFLVPIQCVDATDGNTCFVIGPDYSSLQVPDTARRLRVGMANPHLELWSHQVLAIAFAKWGLM